VGRVAWREKMEAKQLLRPRAEGAEVLAEASRYVEALERTVRAD
jgi:hypothetical protein